MIDIDQVRRDIPSAGRLIHFNNAGASLMPQPVYDEVINYLRSEQQIGGYETANLLQHRTDNFYLQAARLVGCETGEIAFSESATRAWQMFFYSMAFKSGDKVITTQLDYGSNFVGFIQQRNRHGIEVTVIDSGENGDIDLDAMEKAIDDRTKLISVGHIPTGNGVVQLVEKVGQLARAAGVPFLLDACQSVGQVQVGVKKIGCTAASVTGRKYIRGPRGSGFLYVDRQYLDRFEPFCVEQYGVSLQDRDHYVLHDSAKRFEHVEVGYANRVGLGRALQYINEIGIAEIEASVIHMGKTCREVFSNLPQVTLHDQGSRQGGIVTFSVNGVSPNEVRSYLNRHGVNIWVSTGPGSLVDFQERGI